MHPFNPRPASFTGYQDLIPRTARDPSARGVAYDAARKSLELRLRLIDVRLRMRVQEARAAERDGDFIALALATEQHRELRAQATRILDEEALLDRGYVVASLIAIERRNEELRRPLALPVDGWLALDRIDRERHMVASSAERERVRLATIYAEARRVAPRAAPKEMPVGS